MRGAAIVAAAMVLGTAGAAQARPLPDGGVTAQEVAQALQAKGYRAELTKDSQGDPMVRSAAEGLNFAVYFYDCGKGRCTSIEFMVGLDVEKGATLQKAAEWNHDYRFARMSLDEENDPFFHYDVDVERGATSEAIDNAIDRWLAIIPEAKKFVGF